MKKKFKYEVNPNVEKDKSVDKRHSKKKLKPYKKSNKNFKHLLEEEE